MSLSHDMMMDIFNRAAGRRKTLDDIKKQANTPLVDSQFIFSLSSVLCLFSEDISTNYETIAGIADTYLLGINPTREDGDSFFAAVVESINLLAKIIDGGKF